MWASIVKFLFATPIGRGVLIGGGISIGIAAGWWLFSSHYEGRGYARCQSEHLAAAVSAAAGQARKNAENNQISSQVGKDTADAVSTTIAKADENTGRAKETITDVYRDPPKTAPVVLGSCVHPVDPRVQERIDAAVSRTTRAP